MGRRTARVLRAYKVVGPAAATSLLRRENRAPAWTFRPSMGSAVSLFAGVTKL